MTRESDIELVKRAGRRLRTEHLEVRANDSLLLRARVAVIVGKHGHTIVERNLLRRRLRELIRTMVIPAVGAMDIVLRALPSGYEATFDELGHEINQIIEGLQRESVEP